MGQNVAEGPCVYLWLLHVDVWQKATRYFKAIILQLQINFFLKKSKKERSVWDSANLSSSLGVNKSCLKWDALI